MTGFNGFAKLAHTLALHTSSRVVSALSAALTICVATTVLTGVCVRSASAQASSAPPLGTIASPEYRISVEDVIEIQVVGVSELAITVVSVLSDGTINYPYAGRFSVVDKSIAQVEGIIRKALIKRYVNPQVIVRVRERQLRQVNVLGAVRNIGKLPMRDNWRVLDAITAAGGLPSDRYEFYKATLYSPRAGTVKTIDLPKLFADASSDQNAPLQPDDLISIDVIDESKTTIQVVGEVAKPGPVVVPRTRSVIDVLQAAGGPTPRAALKKAVIERNGASIAVDLSEYQKTGKEIPEKIEPGDRLVVPANKLEYYVFGSVPRSGTQIYPDDRKLMLSTALADAGGTVAGAELKKTRIIRKKDDGTTTTEVVDMEKMLKTGDLANDVPVNPGDTIYVPASGKRGITFLEVFGIVQFIPSLFILLDRVR